MTVDRSGRLGEESVSGPKFGRLVCDHAITPLEIVVMAVECTCTVILLPLHRHLYFGSHSLLIDPTGLVVYNWIGAPVSPYRSGSVYRSNWSRENVKENP